MGLILLQNRNEFVFLIIRKRLKNLFSWGDCTRKYRAAEIGEQSRQNCARKCRAVEIGEQSRQNCARKCHAAEIGEQSRQNCARKFHKAELGEQYLEVRKSTAS
jgi:hypothetical protein